VKNTISLKTISKSERRHDDVIDGVKRKEGSMILKTRGAAGVSRWIGRMGQEGGLFVMRKRMGGAVIV
jgi:hypothetical protein